MRLGLTFVLAIVACSQVKEDPPRKIEAWETAGGSRLRPIFVTVGGVRQFVAFEDRLRKERCLPTPYKDETRCLPRAVQPSLYVDPACTEPGAALDERCEDSLPLIQNGSDLFTTAPIERAYRPVPSCGPVTADSGARFVVAREPVAATDYVKFTRDLLDVGARLKLRVLRGDDGSRYVAGLYDTTFDADCAFAPAADGSVRCLPGSGAPWIWDETCSFEVSIYESEIAPRALTRRRTGCSGYPAVAATDLGLTRVAQRDSEGKCVPLSMPYKAVRIGDELAPTEFAPEVRERVGGTRIKQWVATIGNARLPGQLEDEVFGTRCNFVLESSAYRCLPFSWRTGEDFSDAACKETFVCLVKGCYEPPRYTFERAGRCAYTIREMGEPRDKPTATFANAFHGLCGPSTGVTCDEYRGPGPIVPRETLATGNLIVE